MTTTLTALGANNDIVNHSELNEWSLGVVQEIDAAAMSVWLQYDNFSGHVSDLSGNKFDFEDLKSSRLAV